jgi:uncharacterized protein YecT (DUF1311 family)
MKIKMLAAALTFATVPMLVSTAQAAVKTYMAYPYSKEYTQCMEKQGGSTAGSGACIDAEFKLWDTRLNKAYKDALKFKAAPKAWRQAQRDWLKYKDSQCYALIAAPHGSGDSVDASTCNLNMTIERTLQLESDTWPSS